MGVKKSPTPCQGQMELPHPDPPPRSCSEDPTPNDAGQARWAGVLASSHPLRPSHSHKSRDSDHQCRGNHGGYSGGTAPDFPLTCHPIREAIGQRLLSSRPAFNGTRQVGRSRDFPFKPGDSRWESLGPNERFNCARYLTLGCKMCQLRKVREFTSSRVDVFEG